MGTCSRCGKECTVLKRCSICKHDWYCGADCQKAAWKGHKKTCCSVDDAFDRMNDASDRCDWRGVLKWEGRMEQMMENVPDFLRDSILFVFSWAHRAAMRATMNREMNKDHTISLVRLETRRVEVLGTIQRFRDQGEAMCGLADILLLDGKGKSQEAAVFLARARGVGEAHGFFSVESRSCLGLARIKLNDGLEEEGFELMRHALAASAFREDDCDTTIELNTLYFFTPALLETDKIGALDEVEPLVRRYLDVAKAESGKTYMGACYPV